MYNPSKHSLKEVGTNILYWQALERSCRCVNVLRVSCFQYKDLALLLTVRSAYLFLITVVYTEYYLWSVNSFQGLCIIWRKGVIYLVISFQQL